MSKFSERLKLLRTSRDLSQLELSKYLKVSKSSINMYERGEREPGIETLEKIADHFNVDMDYLLGKSEIANRSIIVPELVSDYDYTPEETDLIYKYRCLDDRGQAAVRNVLEHEYNSLPGEKTKVAPKEA